MSVIWLKFITTGRKRVLVITSNQRQTGFIWVLLLAVLLLTPLVWLNHLLGELRVKDENYLDMQARERLLNEMASFQERLKPERHIEMALEDMRNQFGLELDAENPHRLIHSYATDPMLIRSDFPASAAAFLQKNYNMSPLLAYAVDCDMQNVYSYYSQKLFSSETSRQIFEKAAAYWMVFSQHEVVNELSTTPSMKQLDIEYRGTGDVRHVNAQSKFGDRFLDHISPFGSPPTANSVCRTFFSNRFGSQRSFQILHQLTKPKGLRVSILGAYYFIFNSCDISPARVLEKAMNNEDLDLGRFIVKKTIKQPYFVYGNKHLLYYAGFPSSYFTLIEDYAIKNPKTRQKLREFVGKHGLCTKIDKKHLLSKYAGAQTICNAMMKASLLLFFALLIRSFIQDLEYGLRLAKKLRVAVAIIVMLPILGVFLVIEQQKNSNEKFNLIKCQTKIRQQLDFLGKIINDTDSRVLMMMLETKEYLTYSYYQLKDKSIPEMLREGHFRKVTSGILETTLTRDGGEIVETDRGSRDQTKVKMGLYKILLDLGAVNSEAPEIKKIHKQYTILIGLAGALSNLFAEPESLAREGLANKHIMSASALIKSVHHFIVHPLRPKVIEAIALFMVDEINIIKKLYSQLSQRSLRLFSDYDENCRIEYAMAMRSPTSLRTYQAPYFSSPSSKMAKLAAIAMNNKTSGTIVRRDRKQLRIDSWIISDVSPVIILARATLNHNPSTNLLFVIIPWALLTYAILAVALISDVLADIFLAPVRALLAFVSRLRKNDLQVKVVVASGGEFEELGNSFNQMSEGLRQREKMRRFVSDKLVSSLEADGATLHPAKASLSVLSSDIRGFTTLSEQYSPEEIVSLLNDYFSCMEEALQMHGGAIEKIVGDAIIAAFYSDSSHTCHAVRACKAAREMKSRLETFNR
ncbi:MAG: hypothetical protein ACD_39C00595G0002, partial [uncultured bacterium]